MATFPDVVALRRVSDSVTISSIATGATVSETITLDSVYLIVGMPKVSCSDAEVSVKVVNGGKNEFTIEATNNGSADKSDVVVNYEVYVLKGV